jgi:NAD(P)-dependent dehydrogenase (short-subunit alcohol dehydrogenase family)
MQKRAVHSHMIASWYGAPLMVARGQGLIVEITDGFDYRYRGNLFYSLAKISAIHLAESMAAELKPHGVAAVSVTPGFLRSEEMLDYFGVTEENWKDAVRKTDFDPNAARFIASESPAFVARGVAALAADPNIMARTGSKLTSWGLSEDYGLTDADGSRPHWGRYAAEQGFYS